MYLYTFTCIYMYISMYTCIWYRIWYSMIDGGRTEAGSADVAACVAARAEPRVFAACVVARFAAVAALWTHRVHVNVCERVKDREKEFVST